MLIGHTTLMELILLPFKGKMKEEIKNSLTRFNTLKLEGLDINDDAKKRLLKVHKCRGKPFQVLSYLEDLFGKNNRMFFECGKDIRDQIISNKNYGFKKAGDYYVSSDGIYEFKMIEADFEYVDLLPKGESSLDSLESIQVDEEAPQ